MVKVFVHARVLQGMHRDSLTGATKKLFGSSEIIVPIQMALLKCPVADPRFVEAPELPLHRLLPLQSRVVIVKGPLRGQSGTVVRHVVTEGTAAGKRNKSSMRIVDVEFDAQVPEPPFGLSIAASITDQYFSTKDVCKSLGITSNVLGKIIGSLIVNDPVSKNRVDIGLNLKRNGEYQLLGYVRLNGSSSSSPSSSSSSSSSGGRNSASASASKWAMGNVVQLLNASSAFSGDVAERADHVNESAYWEMTVRAVAAVADYKMRFPELFDRLAALPHAMVYEAPQLGFGGGGSSRLSDVSAWLDRLVFRLMPRTPFTTQSLSR